MCFQERGQRKGSVRRAMVLLLAAALCFGANITAWASVLDPAAQEVASASSENQPLVTVEGNAVVDKAGKFTGYFELALKVQTDFYFDSSGNPVKVGDADVDTSKTLKHVFHSGGVALRYNADILTPVTWKYTEDLDPGAPNPGSKIDVKNATRVNPVALDTKGPDNIMTSSAQVEGYTPADPAASPSTDATALLVLFAEAPEPGVSFATETEVVVVRFKYDLDKAAEMKDTDSFAFLKAETTPGIEAGSPDKKTVVWFAGDSEAAESSAGQAVKYAGADQAGAGQPRTHFYYYDGAPAMSTTENPKYPGLKYPKTEGSRVLSEKAGVYSYTDNLLDKDNPTAGNVVFRLVNRTSYADGGVNLDNLVTILYYDWDDTLIGVQTVERGDARKSVNDYVETTMIHPDLRVSDPKNAADKANLMDSLDRQFTYRGEYPAEGPGGTTTRDDNEPSAADGTSMKGSDYPLTNKLDYSFYRRPTVGHDRPGFSSPSGPVNATLWEAGNNAGETEPYPYANGWAVVADVKSIDSVWTTLGVGELADADPKDGPFTDSTDPTETVDFNFATYGESEYFDLADFSSLGDLPKNQRILYVKAVYEEGTSLMNEGAYTPLADPTYERYGKIASNAGGTYAIGFTYGRINDAGFGVTRMRDPSLKAEYIPDENGQPGTGYYVRVEVENQDVLNMEITPAATIYSVDYYLTDKYGVNFVDGAPRSSKDNMLNVPTNFDYVNFTPSTREGSNGYVLEATLNAMLKAATEVAEAKASGNSADLAAAQTEFNNTFTIETVTDLNLRYDKNGTAITGTNLSNVRLFFLDAAERAWAKGHVENGYAKLTWHQVQYHIANIDISNYPVFAGGVFDGVGNVLPDATVMAEKYDWCRLMDGCAGGTAGQDAITDLPSLLEAAYKVYVGGETSESLSLLGLDFVNQHFLRSALTGKAYTNMVVFQGDLAAAIQALTAAGTPYAGGVDLGNVTWHEFQHALISKTYQADSAIDKAQLWWSDGTQLTYPAVEPKLDGDSNPVPGSVAGLLDLAWKAYAQGYHSDILKGLDDLGFGTAADQIGEAWMWLRAKDDGSKFTSLAAFRTALETAIGQLQSAGKGSADLPAITWRELQYLLINGSYTDDATLGLLEDLGTIDYWWFNGGTKPMKTLEDLLTAVAEANGDPALLSGVTLDFVNNTLYLRDDFKGTAYEKDDAVTTGIGFTTFLNKMIAMSKETLPADTAKLTDLTWNQVQYYLIHRSLVHWRTAELEGNSATNQNSKQYYWWEGGSTGHPTNITVGWSDDSLSTLIDAAYRSAINGNPQAWNQFLRTTDGISTIQKFRFVKAQNGKSAFSDMTHFSTDASSSDFEDFKKLMEDMVQTAIQNAGEGALAVPGVPTLTWYQIQHYIITSYEGSAVLLPDGDGNLPTKTTYWWREDVDTDPSVSGETPLTKFLADMTTLFETETNATKLKNGSNDLVDKYYPSGELGIYQVYPATGTPAPYEEAAKPAYQTQIKNRVYNLFSAMKNKIGTPYYDSAKGFDVTWYQLQYYSYNFGHNITATASTAASPTEAYDWFKDKGYSWEPTSWTVSKDLVSPAADMMVSLASVQVQDPLELELWNVSSDIELYSTLLADEPENAAEYLALLQAAIERYETLWALLNPATSDLNAVPDLLPSPAPDADPEPDPAPSPEPGPDPDPAPDPEPEPTPDPDPVVPEESIDSPEDENATLFSAPGVVPALWRDPFSALGKRSARTVLAPLSTAEAAVYQRERVPWEGPQPFQTRRYLYDTHGDTRRIFG